MKLSLTVVIVLVTLAFASEIDPMKGVTCCTECNQVRRDQGLSYSYGMESYIFKNQAMMMLKYNMGLDRFMNLLSFYPSNFTTFFADRVLDIDQRVTHKQAAMEVELGELEGDVAYEDLDDAYVLSALQALRTIIDKNLLSQDLEYINTKKKALEEITTRYRDWINATYYKQQMTKNDKKAKVAAMALVQSDLMVMGAIEQGEFVDEMESIRNQCYESRTRNMLKCMELPETARWKQRINQDLLIYRIDNLLNDETYTSRLVYKLRTSASGHVNIKDVGYAFPHRIRTVQQSNQDVYERGFQTILTVFRKAGISPEDSQLYDLISSLRFDGQMITDPTSTLDPNSLEYKAKQNSVWSYITATYLAPVFYERYGKSLLNSLHSACPMTCNHKC